MEINKTMKIMVFIRQTEQLTEAKVQNILSKYVLLMHVYRCNIKSFLCCLFHMDHAKK